MHGQKVQVGSCWAGGREGDRVGRIETDQSSNTINRSSSMLNVLKIIIITNIGQYSAVQQLANVFVHSIQSSSTRIEAIRPWHQANELAIHMCGNKSISHNVNNTFYIMCSASENNNIAVANK